MTSKLSIGTHGENKAVEYLVGQGYIILAQNYRYKRSEIDIIARIGEMLIFIEVKTRSGNAYGYPEEAVDEKKQRKIIEGAEGYIFENNWHGPIRFDIVSIDLKTNEIAHFEDAFW